MRSRARWSGLIAVAAAAVVLTGCGSTAEAGQASGGEGFPVTVTHALGATEIPAAASRIATVGWGSEDVAIALGVVPVDVPTAQFGDDDGDGLLPWTHDAIVAAGAELPAQHDESDGIPYEALAASAPDLILGTNSGLDQQQFDTLSKIAPTVAYPETPWGTPWRESTRLVGEALGKADEADRLISQTEKAMADAMAAYPQVDGKTAMFFWVDATDLGTISYYTPNDARVQYVKDLGFTIAPSIVELTGDSTDFVQKISAEEADKLDADVAIVFVQGGDLATLQNDELLSKIPAVQRGSVVLLEDMSEIMAVSSPTVLSIPWALDDYAQRLGAAAAAVE